MAELQPPGSHINGGGGGGGTLPAPPPPENLGTKRQRRPSVRLGDIGDTQHFDSHTNRRPKQQWKLPPKDSTKTSKVRTLMNLSEGNNNNGGGEDKEGNLDTVAIGSWKGGSRDFKPKRNSTKRVRSNWITKADGDDKFSGGEDVDDVGFRDFDSDSPLKEHSPIHSLDNVGIDVDKDICNQREMDFHRRGVRSRVSEGRDHHDGVELEGPSDTDARNWNNFERNGVRVWLNQLGLGRYAPVFEIHEVDDEVLPMLTLEDLKDMGINAVGSRRKMYCAIQKLGKGFS